MQRIIDLPMLETPSSQHLSTRPTVEEIDRSSSTYLSMFASEFKAPSRLPLRCGLLISAVSILMRGFLLLF